MKKCAQCHGERGDGNGIAKPYFKPAPRDFTTAIFKFRTTESGEIPTDNDIKNSIKKGMPYTGMPAWPDLSNEELENLVYFMKTFAEDFAGPYANVSPITIPDVPSYSPESAKKGRIVYQENQCSDCHGNSGRGNGKSVLTLKDQWGEHIKPADLTKRWTFRGGSSRKDIYRTFTTGLDGTPMPSYSIEPENQWALVDYVYSLSKDEPEYATLVVAQSIEGGIDLSLGKSLFTDTGSALFPVIGQVIEPGREFFPGVNAIEVRAVYNQDNIAIMLTWHDMSAEITGKNSPAMSVLMSDTTAKKNAGNLIEDFSDAVAIQIPGNLNRGIVKPYFLFGDQKNPVDIWFADLAKREAEFWVGRGSGNINPLKITIDTSGEPVTTSPQGLFVQSNYEDGEWTAIFKRKRVAENELSFEERSFIPIAFSVWDGFNKERGNKRGITSWYHIYIEPSETESAAFPMVKYGLLTFLIEIGLIYVVRKKYNG